MKLSRPRLHKGTQEARPRLATNKINDGGGNGYAKGVLEARGAGSVPATGARRWKNVKRAEKTKNTIFL